MALRSFCIFAIVTIGLLFLFGCSNGDVQRLESDKRMMAQELEANKERIKSLDVQIKELNDNNVKLNEEISSLKRRIADAGLHENKDESDFEACKENLRKINFAIKSFALDNNKKYPKKLNELMPNPKYLDNVLICPAVSKDTYSAGYKLEKDGKKYVVRCAGHNHSSMMIKANYPCFDSVQGLEIERDSKKVENEE